MGRIVAVVAVLAALPILTAVPRAVAETRSPPHHDIELWLDPGQRFLRASVRTTLVRDGSVTVQLAPWLDLLSLEVDGRPVDTTDRPAAFDVDLRGGGAHELLFRYEGALPAPTEPGLAYIGGDGAFLPGGGWLPSMGARRVTYRLEMSVPEPLRVIASGRLEREGTQGGRYTAVVASDHSAEEPSVFAGPYTIGEQWHRGIRLRTYFHDELQDLSKDYLERSAQYLDRFSARIGDYPFADFHVISSPLPVGLGFPNLTYVGRAVLPMPFMRGPSLAHEILHNWWGNGVYVDYARGNWSEGLTTYMADYALVAENGADAARELRRRWLRDYAALPAELDKPVTAFKAKSHDADQVIGYNKVAFIFYMLERRIGAGSFGDGLRLFWKNHRFDVAGWPDLRRAFEEASGHDLGDFFEQWVHRAGAPTLFLRHSKFEQDGTGDRVTVTLGQDAPPYRLDIPLMVETETQSTNTLTPLDSVMKTASVDVTERPRTISVDPDHAVFRRLDPSETPAIFRSVTLNPRAVALVATSGPDAEATARRLAARLLGAQVRFVDLDTPLDGKTPLLLIGTTPRIGRALEAIAAGEAPEAVSRKGTARAWANRRADGGFTAVVAADDAKALAATVRALPHYGRMSYLAFRGGTVIHQGVWPTENTPLRHTFNARQGLLP